MPGGLASSATIASAAVRVSLELAVADAVASEGVPDTDALVCPGRVPKRSLSSVERFDGELYWCGSILAAEGEGVALPR